VMAVLKPLRVVLENYPEGKTEYLEARNNPEDEASGSRQVPFTRVIYIDQDDFREDPPKKYFRLSPGREVRLRYGFIIKCNSVVKDPATGEVIELRCTYDERTRSGFETPEDRKRVQATIHWVSAEHALDAEVRLYDRLFVTERPGEGEREFIEDINPTSLEVLAGCKVEPSLATARPQAFYQFERLGYFAVDADTRPDRLVFNRTVTLRDQWAKIEKAQPAKKA
jgi:glutaminyl-tRNA synthetase